MNLLQMSLSGAVFIFIVVLLRVFAINKLPKTTFLVLWDIALLRLLLPVSFRFPFSVHSIMSRSIPALDTFESDIADFTAGVLWNQPGGIENDAPQILQGSVRPVSVLPIIWAVGVAVMAGYFMVSYLKCRSEFQTALPVQNDFTQCWLRRHAVRRTIEIRQLTGLPMPLTYGVFRPVILVPKDMDWSDVRQARYVLFHEYVHIRRFDAVVKLIASAALCIHWFNPLVWVLCVLLNRDIEMSCDECVIRHFGEKGRKAYAMALIRMEEQRSGLEPFGNYFGKNATKERVKAIMKFKKKTGVAIAFAAFIAAVGAVAAFAIAPQTENKDMGDFKDILQGDARFLYVAEGAAEPKSIHDVPAFFDPYDVDMKIWAFAVQDLNNDGEDEVILFVVGAAGDMGGKVILHRIDGEIYGYITDNRTLVDLKTDGTYSYSVSTGVVEGGICSIAGFTETGYTLDKITYGHGTYEGWDTFVVEHQPATEEDYFAAENRQAEKPDAVWYDFTAENIESRF